MARFWRFKNDDFPGEFIYIDPTQIVGVSRESKYDNDGNDCYVIALRSGDEYYIHDPIEGQKLLRWAESEAEAMPVVEPAAMSWR